MKDRATASNYIYGAAGFFSGSTTNQVYVWDTDYNLVAEADVSNVQTSREISLDKEGNLYVGRFGHCRLSGADR